MREKMFCSERASLLRVNRVIMGVKEAMSGWIFVDA